MKMTQILGTMNLLGYLEEATLLTLGWLCSGHHGHLGSEVANGRSSSLLLSVTLPFNTNKYIFKKEKELMLQC